MKLPIAFFMVLIASRSFACDCASANADEWINNSYSVFIGQLTEESEPSSPNQKVTFKVLEKFKGSFSEKVTLKVFGPYTSCAMSYKKSVKYIISTYLEDGNIVTGQCSSYEESEAIDLINNLRSMKTSNKSINYTPSGLDSLRAASAASY